MVDDEYTNPEVIFAQYQFGFASLAAVEVDPLSAASSGAPSSSSSIGSLASGEGFGGGGVFDDARTRQQPFETPNEF
jgi:hypothetical protein